MSENQQSSSSPIEKDKIDENTKKDTFFESFTDNSDHKLNECIVNFSSLSSLVASTYRPKKSITERDKATICIKLQSRISGGCFTISFLNSFDQLQCAVVKIPPMTFSSTIEHNVLSDTPDGISTRVTISLIDDMTSISCKSGTSGRLGEHQRLSRIPDTGNLLLEVSMPVVYFLFAEFIKFKHPVDNSIVRLLWKTPLDPHTRYCLSELGSTNEHSLYICFKPIYPKRVMTLTEKSIVLMAFPELCPDQIDVNNHKESSIKTMHLC